VTQLADDVVPVAYVDSSPDALAATAASGIPEKLLFTDLQAAMRAAAPEAALVTTGVVAHGPVALAALDAGLHVLVEKPFAPTLGRAAAIVRAAAAAGRVLAVSQNYRHHPAALLAAELVRERLIGTVEAVEIDFRRAGRRMVEEAVLHRGLRQPLLMDMAIHHFDLLRVVLGREPTWIECHGMQPLGPHRDPLAAYATISFDGLVLSSYRGNWVSSGTPTAWSGEWRIEGSDGAIAWTGRGDPGVADHVEVQRPDRPPEVVPLPEVLALGRAGVLRAFTAAIRTGSEPGSSGRENLLTLALTLAAVRSATEGRRVDVAELLTDVPPVRSTTVGRRGAVAELQTDVPEDLR
jgi:predicted dehydrogenase